MEKERTIVQESS